ncbi:hypothetical protein D3C78_1592460 [compost metagenome]
MGTLYDRDDEQVLMYKEDEAGVSTSIRMQAEEIRLFRRGSMESWQVFRLGEYTNGMLSLGVNAMHLSVMTSHFHLSAHDGGGRLELHYQLFTAGSSDPAADPLELSMGRFELALDWTVTAEA